MKDINLLKSLPHGSVVYGVDAHSANKQKRTGVEQYSRYLIQAMKPHALREDERVVLYSFKKLDDELGALPKQWHGSLLKWKIKRGWMSIRFSWEMLQRAPRVLFVPGQALPKICPKATVTTIHDVAFKRRPDLYEPKLRRRLERVTKRSVKKAAKILTPSEATKNDLVELYKVNKDRIHVTPLAVDTHTFHPYTPQEAQPAMQKYRMSPHFFLTVGRLEKKKNITTLIRAFEIFKRRRGVGDPYELVLIGEPGYGYDRIKTFIERSSYKDQIRQLGYVEDQEMALLMSQASAYVFPSWYEGFGIPNLEAMAVETPLITSDIPVHREVVGEAGILVSPKESEDWAGAFERLVQNASLQETLKQKGKERVAMYSWEKTAEETWKVLQSFL